MASKVNNFCLNGNRLKWKMDWLKKTGNFIETQMNISLLCNRLKVTMPTLNLISLRFTKGPLNTWTS